MTDEYEGFGMTTVGLSGYCDPQLGGLETCARRVRNGFTVTRGYGVWVAKTADEAAAIIKSLMAPRKKKASKPKKRARHK